MFCWLDCVRHDFAISNWAVRLRAEEAVAAGKLSLAPFSGCRISFALFYLPYEFADATMGLLTCALRSRVRYTLSPYPLKRLKGSPFALHLYPKAFTVLEHNSIHSNIPVCEA